MELRHLRYFVAVAEELSFSRAAARLRLAQPSLSAQIRNLEDELGLGLLERSRNHVALTDAGRVFLGEAREVLARAETAVHRAREAARGAAGELRIGAIGSLTLTFLPSSLTAYHEEFPQVHVTVQELSAPEQIARLAAGELHVGFIPTPFPPVLEGLRLHSERLLRCPIVAVMNPRHPLAQQPEVSLRALADERFLHIRLARTEGHRIWTESICRKAGFTPKFGGRAENPENLLSLVASGHGVALVPKFSERAPSPGYVFRPLTESENGFELFTIWNPLFPSALLTNFLKIVAQDAQAVQASLTERPKSGRKRSKKADGSPA